MFFDLNTQLRGKIDKMGDHINPIISIVNVSAASVLKECALSESQKPT
jgi:hypothetical protein